MRASLAYSWIVDVEVGVGFMVSVRVRLSICCIGRVGKSAFLV